ncbi:MAG: hypothetical protein MUF84_15170 [Anaerolineae bacterium]|nr:hypothetical protein [Anaerolineae bacterium]
MADGNGATTGNGVRLVLGRLWVWLLCAVLCVALFWDVLLAPADTIVGGNDLASMFRIWLDFAKSALRAGELPLWNPYLFSGTSFVSDPQPSIFYPPTWLALALPTPRALGLIIILHVWWSMVGAVQWLRSETDRSGLPLSWSGALAGASVFAFSGYPASKRGIWALSRPGPGYRGGSGRFGASQSAAMAVPLSLAVSA